jgi:hypothetical protein
VYGCVVAVVCTGEVASIVSTARLGCCC